MRLLGDGGEAGYELRNKNQAQLKCLEGEQESLSPAVAVKCNEWRACLPDKRQEFLKTFLRSLLRTTKITKAPPATTKVWNPGAMCGGTSAASRAKWLENHRGMSEGAARKPFLKGEKLTSVTSLKPPPCPAPPCHITGVPEYSKMFKNGPR